MSAELRMEISTVSLPTAGMVIRSKGQGGVYESDVYEPGVYLDFDPSRLAVLDVEVLGSLQSQLFPTDEQLVTPLRWSIGGIEVPDHLILDSSLDADEDGESWTLVLVADSDNPAVAEPYGDPLVTGQIPGGKLDVDCWVIYLTAAGPKRVQMMTGGVVENSTLNLSEGVRRISGMGPRGRWVEKTVDDYLLPRGHGKTRGEVASELLEHAGMESPNLTGGAKMLKAVEAQGVRAVALADDILSAELKRLSWNAEGEVEIVDLLPSGLPDFTVTEETILAQQALAEETNTDGPSLVIVTADLPIPTDGCGSETRVTRTEVFQPYGPKAPSHKVDSSCNTSASGLVSAPVELRKVSETVFTQELRCGSVISERREHWGYKNPLKSYRTLDGGASPTVSCSAAYIDDPEGEARQFSSERWVKLEESTRVKEFDNRGYLIGEVREKYGWSIRKAALKSRSSSSDNWEAQAFITGRRLLVRGDGVAEQNEAFRLLEQETIGYTVTDDGFITRQDSKVDGYVAPLGDLWLYNGGEERSQSSETFQTVQTATVTWEGGEEDQELVEVETVEHIDEPGPVITRTTRPGHLPAAEILEDFIGRIEAFSEAGEAGASYYDSQPVEVEIDDQEIADGREERTDRIHHEWIETLEEAEAYADYRRLIGRYLAVTYTCPVNAALRPGRKIALDLPSILGKKYELIGRNLSHRGGDSLLTTFSGDHLLG